MKWIYLFLAPCLFLSCNQPQKLQREFSDFINNFDPSAGRTVLDLSAESYDNEVNWLYEQIKRVESYQNADLSEEDQIDLRFAESILKGRHIRLSQHQSWKKDPRNYMRFRSIGNTIGKPGDPEDKIQELKEKLSLVPTQLENGIAQLEIYIPRFQELSLFMAKNGEGLFKDEIPAFLENYEASTEMNQLVENCQSSLAAFITFLENDLPGKPEGIFATGKGTFNQILKNELLLDYNDESLWNYGNEKFEETTKELEELAKKIDPAKTWQELAVEIKNNYPEPHKMIEAHQFWVDSSKAHILAKDLMPIPWEEKVDVVPRAEYLRKTSYYGNFSRARGKDSDSIFTAQWMINPFEDQWDDKTKAEYLVEHDWGVIIVTAPHEAYGGHHVQGLYQLHNPRKIRRENGLSLFSEGWGLYNEHLMGETGFYPNDSIKLRQLQLRLWRNARVIYDTGMHSERMTYEDAVSLMTDRVGFLRWAAQLEIDSASARPGYFIGYYIGMMEILKMRDDYKSKMGEDFTLSDFHENLMKIGNMPPKLMAEVLLSDNL